MERGGRAVRLVTVVVFVLSLGVPISAQSRFTFPTEKERQVTNWVTWGTVIANLTLDALACHGDKRCLLLMGARVGGSIVTAETIKHFVPSDRPCAPADCGFDNPRANMPSEHAWLAASSIDFTGCAPGPRLAFQLPLTLLTDAGRYGSRRHTLGAIAAGSAGGFLASVLTRCR